MSRIIVVRHCRKEFVMTRTSLIWAAALTSGMILGCNSDKDNKDTMSSSDTSRSNYTYQSDNARMSGSRTVPGTYSGSGSGTYGSSGYGASSGTGMTGSGTSGYSTGAAAPAPAAGSS